MVHIASSMFFLGLLTGVCGTALSVVLLWYRK